MICDKINLGHGETEAVLYTYISSECDHTYLPNDGRKSKPHAKRPAVIVFPGGAYHALAWHEGEPVIKKFLANGFNAFLLHYTVGDGAARFPRPLLDASLAVAHVREHAEEYNVDPDRIFILGFSAGGHLAASLGTLWHKDLAKPYADLPCGLNKPNGMILCYPALTPYNGTLEGMFKNIWGSTEPGEDFLNDYDIIRNVSENTPPAFLWHTANDGCVPVQNTLIFADKMFDFKRSVRLHIYENGYHGLGLADAEATLDKAAKPVDGWIDEVMYWVDNH